jgi:hypothetical protein
MSKTIGPITYSFSAEDIRKQRVEGFAALFTMKSLSTTAAATQLVNSVHIGFDLPKDKRGVAPCELPEVRAFCRRLFDACPVLPWVAALNSQLYIGLIYSILPEVRVMYREDRPGKYFTTFAVEEMEEIITQQVKMAEKIGKRAKLYPVQIGARTLSLQRYLRDGKDIL